MDEVFSIWPDLTDQPVSHPDVEYFTDGSNFVWEGTHFVGYAVVTLDTVTEPDPLLVVTSTQKAELIALTCALSSLKECG
jgi:ribonuclease HI